MKKSLIAKKTSKLLLVALALAIVLSFGAAPVAADENDTLFVVYLLGTDLENKTKNYFSENIGQLLSAWDEKSGKLLVFYGGSNDNLPGWSLTEISVADYANLIKDYQNDKKIGVENNAVTPYRLAVLPNQPGTEDGIKAAIQYANAYAEANGLSNAHRYILISDHGGAHLGIGEGKSVDMSNSQVGKGLTATNKKFDIIIFDACLMANLEVAYELKDLGNYLLASEETVPGAGLNYVSIAKALSPRASKDAKTVASTIIQGYIPSTSGTEKTLSLIDLSKINTVIAKIDAFGAALTGALNAQGKEASDSLGNIYLNSERFGEAPKRLASVDLYSFAKGVANNANGSIKTSAEDLMKTISEVVVLNRYTSDYKDAHGITIAPIGHLKDVSENVVLTNSNWATFLKTYLRFVLSNGNTQQTGATLSYSQNAAQVADVKSTSTSPGTLTITNGNGLTEVYVDYLQRVGDKYYIVSQDLAKQSVEKVEGNEYWSYLPTGNYTVEEEWDGTAFVLENAVSTVPVTLLYKDRDTIDGTDVTEFIINGDFTRTVDGKEKTLPSYLTVAIDTKSGFVYDVFVTSGSPDDTWSSRLNEWNPDDVLPGDKFTPMLDYMTEDSDKILSEKSTKTFVFGNNPLSEIKKKQLNEDDCFWEYEIVTITAGEDADPYLVNAQQFENGTAIPLSPSAKSPAPFVGLLAGLGAAAVLLRMRS